MSFSADIARYAKKVGLEADEAVVAVCSKLTTLVIEKTPVDSGRLRGNWFASIDDYSSSIDADRTEAQAVADGLMKARMSSGKLFTLTNNLPYAQKVEYGMYPKNVQFGSRVKGGGFVKYEVKTINGFSTQAPAGMSRLSIQEIKNAFK